MADQDTVQQLIREKLEASGQVGKMRAMIVDAALQALNEESSPEERLFVPKSTLKKARESEEGKVVLGSLVECLEYLGLDYTASVLKLEGGLAEVNLPSREALVQRLKVSGKPDTAVLMELMSDVLAGKVNGSSGGSNSAPLALPVPVPSPMAQAPTSAVPPVIPLVQPTVAAAVKKNDDDDADHPAGHEDSTYFISKWNKRSFLRKNQVTGQQVQIEYLNDCTVTILDPLDSMTVDDCEGGTLIIAACEGSVFLRNCKNMTVHVACKQLRTRDCENIELHIFTTTDPVVEMSHHMNFRPFHIRLPSLKKSMQDCRLDPKTNRFVHVYDFTVDAKGLPQPHFKVFFPEHGVEMEDMCADQGTPECPPEIEDLVALRLMPAASSESGQNKSYDIKTGAAMWAASAAEGKKSSDSSEEETEAEAEEEEEEEEEEEVPSAPVVPTLTATEAPAKTAATPGGLDDQEYSSFDESEESSNPDDKYSVEEDDDDF